MLEKARDWMVACGRRDGIYQVKQKQGSQGQEWKTNANLRAVILKPKKSRLHKPLPFLNATPLVVWGQTFAHLSFFFFCKGCCFSTEAKGNIWGRGFPDAITARHWSSGLHVGKHVLSHRERSLAWQALLQTSLWSYRKPKLQKPKRSPKITPKLGPWNSS